MRIPHDTTPSAYDSCDIQGEMKRVRLILAKHPEQLDAQDPDTGLSPLHYAAK
jgi:hypothetical protein